MWAQNFHGQKGGGESRRNTAGHFFPTHHPGCVISSRMVLECPPFPSTYGPVSHRNYISVHGPLHPKTCAFFTRWFPPPRFHLSTSYQPLYGPRCHLFDVGPGWVAGRVQWSLIRNDPPPLLPPNYVTYIEIADCQLCFPPKNMYLLRITPIPNPYLPIFLAPHTPSTFSIRCTRTHYVKCHKI